MVAFAAIKQIVAIACAQEVFAIPAKELVVAKSAQKRVVATATCEQIVARSAVKRIIAANGRSLNAVWYAIFVAVVGYAIGVCINDAFAKERIIALKAA